MKTSSVVAVALALLTSFTARAQVCGRGLSDVTVAGSQVLNTFHPAPPGVTTTVLAGANSIPVAAARAGGGAAIATGDLVVVIQMQGAAINRRQEGTTNGTYGDGAGGADRRGVLAGAGFRAGLYEYARAAGPVTAGSLPLMSGLANAYLSTDAITGGGADDGSAVHRYQVVRIVEVRDLTIPVGATLTSLPWDGASGGLVAVDAARDMVVNGRIDVTGMGFRGGSPIIPTANDNPQACVKGEGIAGRPTRLYSRLAGVVTGASGMFGSQSERGAPGNAGGCPSTDIDSGGGGGGGGRQGGIGSLGPASNVDPNIPRPGEGYALLTRLLMGGGGGSGSLDDPTPVNAVSGAAGGGIVLVRATNLSGATGVIQADGDSVATQSQEGGGGGGGGGGVFVFTNSTSFAGIALNSRGGNGGTTQTTQDGGGGGGGGGFVLVATPTGMATVTVNVAGGLGGTSPTQNGGVGSGGFQQVNIPPLGTPPCPVQCTIAAHCDDGNACTTDTCNAGTCSNAPVTAGQPGACAGALVCSGPPTNTCVQCVTNAQCSAPTPICDSANVCRAAPVVNAPANGSVTNNRRPVITGTAEASSTVTVLIDGVSIGTTTATAMGTFSFTPTSDLAPGARAVSVTAGSPALPSNTNTFTIDVTAPAAPTVTTPADGSFTNNQRPPVTGTAEANSTVTVFIDGVSVGTTTASAAGAFSFTPPANLAAGPHTVRVTATDAAGNVSPDSNTNTFTVDLTAPTAPTVTTPANGSFTNNQRPPVTGTAEANSTVTVFIDGVSVGTTTASAAGAFSFTPPANLAAGPHTVRVTATDAAGNVSPDSNTNTFTIDVTAPTAPVVSTPANGSTTSNLRPAITGTAEAGSTVTIRIDGLVAGTTTATAGGTFSFTPTADLAQGGHTVQVTSTDAAGNTSVPSNTNTFTVDNVAPAAPVVTAPANNSSTNSQRPPITGTAEANSTVTITIDGMVAGTTTATAGGSFSFTPTADLGAGPHTVSATARDAGGNVSPASNTNTFTVDLTAPAAPVVTTPANGSTVATARPPVTGTAEANSTVTVRIDGNVVGTTTANAMGAFTFTPPADLPQGSHTVNVTATDAAGNVSPASNTNTFTIDSVAPAAPVVTAPADGSTTANPRPTISGTAEANSTVTVRVDGNVVGTTTANAMGAWTFTPASALSNGSHTVNATAADAAGNTSPASNTNTFTVAAAAGVPVVTTPADGSSTNNVRPAISGTAPANATVTVSVDGSVIGTTTADGMGAWTLTPTTALSQGSHTVNATATVSGMTSGPSNTNTFTVDTMAPAAPVVTAPANGSSTNDPRPAISGTAEANATITVRVDGMVIGTTTANAMGAWTLTPMNALSAGSHTVSATATDAAGNASPASNTNTFTIDTSAPTAPVVSSPADGSTTAQTRPVVSGTAEPNSTVTIRLDGMVAGTTTADATGAFSFTPGAALSNGSHTVNATATDAAGNVSPVSNTNTFTVDPSAGPTAPVITAPANGSTTTSTRPPVSGTAPPNSTVTVRIDGAPACTATASATGAFSCTPATALTDGPHVVTATAVVGAQTSPSSAPTRFTVDATPPLTPAVVGPANGSVTSDTTPTVTGTGEPGSTVTVRVDGMSAGTTTVRPDGTWTFDVPTALALGSHTVSAIAADAAGNQSLPSNTNTFSVVAAGAPVVTSPADNSVVNTTTPMLGGTAGANEVVTVRVDGMTACTATANAMGAFSCAPTTALAEGRHTVTATTPDGAGGVRTSNTNTFTIDTMAPSAPVVVTPADGSTTANTRLVLSGTAEPFSTVTVTLDGNQLGTAVADASGVWSLTPTTALAAGMHTVSARATDRAGNQSPVSNTNTFTVSTSAPSIALQTPVDGAITNTARPGLSGTATPNAMVEARVDGMVVCTTTADASGAWSCVPSMAIADGRHVATATIMGTMTTSNTNAFTVDTVAPAAPVVTSPGDGSFQPPTPRLSGTAEPGSRVTVSIDGNPVCVTLADARGNWSCSPAMPLTMGMHTVTATATDSAGNTSAPSTPNRFTVDTMAPNAPVLTTPANGSTTTNTRPTLSGTAEPGSTVAVSVDGNEVCRATTDAQGAFSCTPTAPLMVGMRSARAVATDAAGNASMPSNTNVFTITTPSGAPTITSPADGTKTKNDTPTFTGTAPPSSTVTVREGSTVICSAMADAMGAWRCTPSTPFTEGPHTVTAIAVINGMDTPPSTPTTVTVDKTPPTVTITSGPEGRTTDPKGTFTFTSNEPGTTFECSIDDGPFMACTSPTETDLGPGTHSLVVRATDPAGNTATTRREWTIAAPLEGRFAGGGCTAAGVGQLGLLWVLAALGLRRRNRA
ncbi:MAG: hypothetical protein JNJ54_08105 [Myxococcaceae bacterium]|nr:hypothetical protein [Myxococcaceae bacterium]